MMASIKQTQFSDFMVLFKTYASYSLIFLLVVKSWILVSALQTAHTSSNEHLIHII